MSGTRHAGKMVTIWFGTPIFQRNNILVITKILGHTILKHLNEVGKWCDATMQENFANQMNTVCRNVQKHYQQECIPVGCVPPAHWPTVSRGIRPGGACHAPPAMHEPWPCTTPPPSHAPPGTQPPAMHANRAHMPPGHACPPAMHPHLTPPHPHPSHTCPKPRMPPLGTHAPPGHARNTNPSCEQNDKQV